METIFHYLQFAPAFLRTRIVVQEKAIKICPMHFDGNHFSLSAICTCFLKNKNSRARKGYKNLSVSLPTNAVALTLENIKERKKK